MRRGRQCTRSGPFASPHLQPALLQPDVPSVSASGQER